VGITHVINSESSVPNKYPEFIQYMNIDIQDDGRHDISVFWNQTNDFIDEARRSGSQNKVMVHCWGGGSRSVTIILAYLITHEGLTAEEALTLVRETRKRAKPNPGFWKRLLELEDQVNKTRSAKRSLLG
jgi:protein-tyrosine phosphatase